MDNAAVTATVDLVGGWSDHCILGIEIKSGISELEKNYQDKCLPAKINLNGAEFELQFGKSELRPIFQARLNFDFRSDLMKTLEVFIVDKNFPGGLIPCQPRDNSAFNVAFKLSRASIHQDIRRRKGLIFGQDVQLIAALQAFLWAKDEGMNDIAGVAICSEAYRRCHFLDCISSNDIDAFSKKAIQYLDQTGFSDSISLRWYASVSTALGQTLLLAGRYDEGIRWIRDAADRCDLISLNAEVAYNVSLSNALCSYLMYLSNDNCFPDVARRWLPLFKDTVNNMHVRFGTMREFQRIYNSLLVNYRLLLFWEGHAERKLRLPTVKEVADTCLRPARTELVYASFHAACDFFRQKALA